MSTPVSPIRPIPANPNIQTDRKRAKLLLKAAKRGDAKALFCFKTHHPRFVAQDPARIAHTVALHDAQLVVAREYGFASWPRWKQFVEIRQLDRAHRAAELIKTTCSNDVRKAQLLLEIDPKLAAFDIYTACVCGNAENVEEFLKREPAIVRRNGGPLKVEPILYACFSRFLRADAARAAGVVKAVKLLLDAGADPNVHFWLNGEKERWLQSTLYGAAGIANHAGLTALLLNAGAVVDANDREMLYHTTEFPDAACLRLILAHGKPPIDQVKYCLGRTLDFEYPEHVALFLKAGADPNFRTNWNGVRTHLHKAVYLGRSVSIVKMLIDAGGDVNAVDERGISILRSAVRNGVPDVVNLLRAVGAHDENMTEADARLGDPITLCLAAARDDVATIDRLLNAGAAIDAAAGPDQTPPLHWAAWRGRLRAVQRLVERGADIHRCNVYGSAALGTAIHGSANCFDTEGGPGMRLPDEAVHGDYPAIVEFLIARGAELPDRILGGSAAVQEILRLHGVPDMK
ncbi:MAG TPA: ankyrin repeat domain-containing protein [Phycisphaerae bacterium]|nr:ankyrin repeat domain-containing protein [Phycisphaerae bacterium]